MNTTNSYTGNVSTSSATFHVPFPQVPNDYVEYGKAFDLAITSVNDVNLVKHCHNMALDSFFDAKAMTFPDWDGLPEIKINMYSDALKRYHQIGWYAAVPKKYVIDKEQKDDEELWDL